MVSVLCIFAVAARTLALVEGKSVQVPTRLYFVAARTLALVEGTNKEDIDMTLELQLARWHWLKA